MDEQIRWLKFWNDREETVNANQEMMVGEEERRPGLQIASWEGVNYCCEVTAINA